MSTELLQEARRQATICNACRYCEGYCSVFPALHRQRAFADGDLIRFANLCHNCRGCYYACQYTAPHAFDLNLPAVLAELRRESWERFAWPGPLARLYRRSGTAIAAGLVLSVALLLWALRALAPESGEGFYAALPHGAMVAIFAPAFLFPLLSLAVSLRRYWDATGGGRFRLRDFGAALKMAATMKDLAAGHGEGCNFEDEDRFSHSRRLAHQAVMYGFLLCFAATCAGTVLHYGLGLPAPYPFWSLPKLLGVSGGVLLTGGTVWMAVLKRRADAALGDAGFRGGEIGFILLLGLVAASGLALYAFGATPAMPALLALHLDAVLAFFLLTPFSKMAHGFYRLAALTIEAGRKAGNPAGSA